MFANQKLVSVGNQVTSENENFRITYWSTITISTQKKKFLMETYQSNVYFK
jgi:hypothetical protein